MRKFIPLHDLPEDFPRRLNRWAAQRKVVCMLDSHRDQHRIPDRYSKFESCVAVDAVAEINPALPAFGELRKFHDEIRDWIFGYLTYDLKNETARLQSANHDLLHFPAIHFFQPRYIFLQQNDGWRLGYLPSVDTTGDLKTMLGEIHEATDDGDDHVPVPDIRPRVRRETYLRNVDEIKKHIQRGDIYELNYCVEFFATEAFIRPGIIFDKLNELSPMPFSCYYRKADYHLVCASPERFIARRGRKIISQPIKGTARRGRSPEQDEAIRKQLYFDEKERSENVMIVDLVRNDLSRTAKRGTVEVEELFGIYTFRQLHQMISTVVSEARNDVHWTEIVRNAFPMGSMTGAPKIRAMELIEKFESSRRGLYSGAAGYVTPDGDFDFNVVIRSILSNTASRSLSFMVGSAITINSDPEREYEECLLKAGSMMQVLQGNIFEKAG